MELSDTSRFLTLHVLTSDTPSVEEFPGHVNSTKLIISRSVACVDDKDCTSLAMYQDGKRTGNGKYCRDTVNYQHGFDRGGKSDESYLP